MDIGKQIKNCRKSLGMTQARLGELSGFTQNTICAYESGHCSNVKNIEIMLNAMGYELAVVKRRQRP